MSAIEAKEETEISKWEGGGIEIKMFIENENPAKHGRLSPLIFKETIINFVV